MRSAEELQTENTNLRCFLWLIVNAAGGTVTIPKLELERFRPATSRVEFWTEFSSGDYFILAKKEEQGQ
jgi:hypothetical protein